MITYKMLFDVRSPYWNKDEEFRFMFVRQQDHYFNELLRARGYVYLNQIHESFGVKWNPKNENLCFTNDECNSLIFVTNKVSPYVWEIVIQVH